MKNILLKFALLFFVFGEVSCGEDIPDCPNKLCILSGGWTLVEAYADDVKESQDLSEYLLTLISPTPSTATSSTFTRIQPSGASDDGTWELQNLDKILVLTSTNDPANPEKWIIESFTPRQLILVLNREPSKDGPSTIKFVLEPF